jgi:mannitol/fructose-specific phosphotransferase system IIA component
MDILQKVAITFSNLEQVDRLERAGSVQEIVDILKEA